MSTDREADTGSLPTVPSADAMAAAETVDLTAGAGPMGVSPRAASPFDAIVGRFAEHGELGRGGMGRVADAFDRTLARQVAIKSMLVTDPEAVTRFEREARITAQLEHPGIVPLYEAGRQADGTPYYVMRRVDGRRLDDAVRSAGLDRRLALVPSLLAVCDAVAFAHARSIVHRDIKPGNILLGRFGETLLIDWGLARRLDERDPEPGGAIGGSLTQAGAITGTPGFMAPEQARGERLDARADVYALGATLFYVLAGTLPHDAGVATELIAIAAAGEPPRWQRLPAGVPDDLRAILGKALAADPAQRYPDAGALAADLRRFVTGNLVAAHRYSAAERLRRFVRRHRVAVTVGGVAAAVLAAVVTVAVLGIARERDDANAARVRETARADDLTIARARLLLDTDPTLAVALVRPLAGSERWREVSDVLAAASARGVAWRLPGSAATWSIDISPDGEHGCSIGSDGRIWLYDLRARTGRVVVELGRRVDDTQPVVLAWRDATHLAMFADTAVAIIDTATGARRLIAIPARVVGAWDGAGVVYWVDAAHRGWRLDGDVPREIAIGEDVERLSLSPDGAQLVVSGKTGLWLVDAAGTGQGGEARRLLDERAWSVAWDSTSTDLVVVTRRPGSIRRLHLADPPVWDDEIGRGWPDRLVMADGHIALQNTSSLWTDLGQVAYRAVSPVGLAVARDGLIVAASSDGAIEVFDHGYRQRLAAPGGRLDRMTSRRTSQYLLAATGADVLVWDLGAVFPRRLARVDHSFGTYSAGPHHLLLPAGRRPSTWIDLAALTTRPGPVLDFATVVEPSPSGARAMSIANQVEVMTVGAADAELVARDVRIARFVDDHRIAVVGRDGHVALHDLDRHSVTPLAATGAQNVYGAGDTVVIGYTDHSYERIELAAGRRARLRPPARPALNLLAGDGRLWIAWDDQLFGWEPDGRLVPYATAPRAITNLFITGERSIVIDTAEAGFRVDAARPGALRRMAPLGTIGRGLPETRASQADEYLAVPRATGGVLIVDSVTGAAWPVGQDETTGATTRTTAPLTAAIAPDGSVAYELRDTTLAVWPLAIARSRAATVALSAALGNAAANDTGDAVTW